MDLPKPLSCSEVGLSRVLRALLNHTLDSDFEDRVLAHLRCCPRCLSKVAVVLRQMGIPETRDDSFRGDETRY